MRLAGMVFGGRAYHASLVLGAGGRWPLARLEAMPAVTHATGVHPIVEDLQIHSRNQAQPFFRRWEGGVSAIRLEPIVLPGGTRSTGVDLILHWPELARLFIVLACSLEESGSLTFPSLLDECSESLLDALAGIVRSEAARAGATGEARVLTDEFPGAIGAHLSAGRAVPGLCPYITAVNHIKRYTFARAHLIPGAVVDCASGAGYGAAVLTQAPNLDNYVGIDLDDGAVGFAKSLVQQSNVEFLRTPLMDAAIGPAPNVLSLETMEHVSDPHAFMEQLIDKLAPDGQLILSMPAEYWAGSHLNPHHVTNWNLPRFEHLLGSYFEQYHVYKQQLSFVGEDTFGRSEIFDRQGASDIDETFVAIAKRPHARRVRSRIVVRRSHALGDTILATPIVKAAKATYPERDVVFVTHYTQALMNNPYVDVLSTPAFRPRPGDEIVDLDNAYESSRHLHIVEAYARRSPFPVADPLPELFPAARHFRQVADALLDRWRGRTVERVVAIHAGATSADRIWPSLLWQEFLSGALGDGKTGLIVVGSAQDYDLAALDALEEPAAVSFVQTADLLTTAAAIALADVLVCPDSGLSHVAAAVRTRSIVLYGMADPATRASLDGSMRPIWSDVPCRGCIADIAPTDPPLCRLERAICMEAIKPGAVLAEYRSAVSGLPPFVWQRKLRALGLDIPFSRPSVPVPAPVAPKKSRTGLRGLLARRS